MREKQKFIKNVPNEVLPRKYCRFSVNRSAYIAKYDMLWGEPDGPPSNWIQGAPIGNGDFGAMAYGYPDNLTFALGKSNIWNRCDPGRSNFPGGTFQDCRHTFIKQDEERFKEIQAGNGLKPYDYFKHAPHFTAAGVFRMHIAETAIARKCTQRLSLYDATCRMEFIPAGMTETSDYCSGAPTRLRYFVSREYDVLVVRLERGAYPLGHITWEIGRARDQGFKSVPCHDGNSGWVVEEMPAGDSYVIAAAVDAPSEWYEAGSRSVGEAVVEDEQKTVTIYLTIVTSGETEEPVAEAKRRLANAQQTGLHKIEHTHKEWWKNFWERSFISFGKPDIEKWWYVSNYLCGSILRPGKQSPGLQGIWIKENIPGWNGDYHGNVNIQSVYWGLYASNHLDLAEPYFRYYTSILPRCRKDTKDYFLMRGVRLPHAGDVYGHEITRPLWVTLAVSIAPSGWIAKLFWDYYCYTGDTEFLSEVAYPLIREVSIFYDDYLLKDGSGRYCIMPSVFGEAYCPTFKAWGKNSSSGLAIVRYALQCAVKASEVLDTDKDLRNSWNEKIDHLAPIPANEEGVWLKWEGREVVEGIESTFPVFPMDLVSAYHGQKELQQQAKATWEYLRKHNKRPGAWCGGWGTSAAVRMGDVDWALKMASWQSGASMPALQNGITGGWDKGYFQVDHGPGMSRALSDIMLLCLGGVIHLFPGVPQNTPACFHSLRTAGAFLVSAEKRSKDVDYVLVQSIVGNPLRIANPFSSNEDALIRDLTTQKIIARGKWAFGEVVKVDTEQKHVYVMERVDRPLESFELRDLP